MKTIFLLDGRQVGAKQLQFAQFKRGFLYGDGVFETMRAFNYKIFRWDQHLERLKNGADVCGIDSPQHTGTLKAAIETALKKNHIPDAYIRLNIWRKEPATFDPEGERGSRLLVIAKKRRPYNPGCYEKGISCIVSKNFFKDERSPITFIKSLNYLPSVLARTEAKTRGYEEAIMLNSKGLLAESAASNLFFCKGAVIYTPAVECGILAGITREAVLQICRQKKIKTKEGRFKPDTMKSADEIFLTNTLAGVLPVRKVEGIFKNRRFKMSAFLDSELEKILLRESGI